MFLALAACTWSSQNPSATEARLPTQLARTDTGAPIPYQTCELPPGCASDGLDSAHCTDLASAFTPTFVGREVVAISVNPDAVATLGLTAGDWWTAWGDGVSCTRVVAWFTVDGEVAP